MDNYDNSEQPVTAPRGRSKIATWDILSIVVLIFALCLAAYFLYVFINPFSPLDPLPPFTPVVPFIIPTGTITPIQLEPTWTLTPTIQSTPSLTPRPTWTPENTTTPFSIFPPPKTPFPSTTPKPTGMPYTAKVNLIESTIIHPESGCSWLGVGGTAEDLNKSPVLGIVVHIGGSLGGKNIDLTTVTGVSPDYGKSGFEFYLGDRPVASMNTLWIILQDLASLPLSEKIYFSTYEDCQKNLILIRFTKSR